MDTGKIKQTRPCKFTTKPMPKKRYGLFEVTGIEMEYMIVDKTSLSVKPLCDKLMKQAAGAVVSDFVNGDITWSNEIVNHVLELKTNSPVTNVEAANMAFHCNVLQINHMLEPFNAILMPTGAHPWMNPLTDGQLWAHGNNEVYDLYNKIFDCRSHGWVNLQSTHVNIPFGNDVEFGMLHAAIRFLLPVLPALSASTPVLDGKLTGFIDTRLEKYRFNQQKIPSITGKVIPEAAFTESAYYQMIFNPMMRDIALFDHEKILECHFLNSRGAIARFDRGAVEIRLLDIQECPLADLAIIDAVNATLKMVIRDVPLPLLERWDVDFLAAVLTDCIKLGEKAVIDDVNYLETWGFGSKPILAGELWRLLHEKISPMMNPGLSKVFKQIVDNGTLGSRIINYLNNDYSLPNIKETYGQLVNCLHENTLFNCPR